MNKIIRDGSPSLKRGYAKAQLAAKAYDKQGLPGAHRFDDGQTQAVLLTDCQPFELAIRGTDSAGDLLTTDLDGLFKDYSTGHAHTGFLNASYELIDWVHAHVNTAEFISITGHSLGGALALLVADRLTPKQVLSVDTFGGPKVFCSANAARFNRKLKGKTHRWVNGADVVPRVPVGGPEWVGKAIRRFVPLPIDTGYRHVGRLDYVDADGKHHQNPSRRFLWLDRMECCWRDLGKLGLASIKMHKLHSRIGYLKRLEALANNERLAL